MDEFDFDFQQIADVANDIILVTKAGPLDPPGPEIVYVNKAFTELTEYAPEEVIGQTPRILQSAGTDVETKNRIKRALQEQAPIRVTIKNYSKTGREYWLDLSILPLRNEAGEVTHFAAIQRDVTEQKERELKLEQLSRTDALTGVLNRRSFDEMLAQEHSRFERQAEHYSLLVLDFDHFKQINDHYGHNHGDQVLKMFADGCVHHLRAHDVVARWGGDEFCVMLPYTDVDMAVSIAEKLRREVSSKALEVGDTEVSITVSIGVSQVHAFDRTHLDVLGRADQALYEAKQSGRNRIKCLYPGRQFLVP